MDISDSFWPNSAADKVAARSSGFAILRSLGARDDSIGPRQVSWLADLRSPVPSQDDLPQGRTSGSLPADSGATAPDSHRLPFSSRAHLRIGTWTSETSGYSELPRHHGALDLWSQPLAIRARVSSESRAHLIRS